MNNKVLKVIVFFLCLIVIVLASISFFSSNNTKDNQVNEEVLLDIDSDIVKTLYSYVADDSSYYYYYIIDSLFEDGTVFASNFTSSFKKSLAYLQLSISQKRMVICSDYIDVYSEVGEASLCANKYDKVEVFQSSDLEENIKMIFGSYLHDKKGFNNYPFYFHYSSSTDEYIESVSDVSDSSVFPSVELLEAYKINNKIVLKQKVSFYDDNYLVKYTFRLNDYDFNYNLLSIEKVSI